MRILWGGFLVALLAGAMALAQDYQAQPSQQVAPGDNAISTDNSVSIDNSAGGVTIEGNSVAAGEPTEGVPAVNYEISPMAQEKGGSLLPREEFEGVSGTLSSWDTSPTGVYKDSKDLGGSPFPMAAAPAIDTGDRNLLPREAELPPSMSGNISSWDTAPTAAYKDYEIMVGSPFPMSADPSIRQGRNKLESVDVDADFSKGTGQPFADTASPFPTAGAPARRNFW